MADKFLKTSFLLGALAVALGAFGAHALKPLLDEQSLHTYQTATFYHSLHVLALAITGILLKQYYSNWLVRAGWLFITGIIFFGGSLYTLTFLKAAGFQHVNWLGAITPIGGLSFISGWISLFMGVHKKNS